MSLLDKISAVEVKADTRISEADRTFCQTHQKAYEDARENLFFLCEQWKSFVDSQAEILSTVSTESYVKERYCSLKDLSISAIEDKLEYLHELLISSIVHYFNGKYHVSVSESKIKKHFLPAEPDWQWEKTRIKEYHKTMQEMVLHYEDIVEQIFVQLGGRTFEERALDELKEKCHDFAWNRHKSTPEFAVKNDTISFNNYACTCDTWFRTPKWKLTDGMKNVLRAVAHFETQQLEYCPHQISVLVGYGEKEESLLEFDYEKLKRLRMYKNCRVDLKFACKEYANQFAETYLGLLA